MEVEAMSRETIKPTSPTPEHLLYHPLSLLDQLNSQVLMPLIFFYSPINRPSNNVVIVSTDNMLKRLKESLATTLAMFYPLVGRIKDTNHIVCSDEGVPYVQARVNCLLVDVVNKAEVSDLDKLLPCKLEGLSRLLLAIQVNVFACGGLAIGLCTNHTLSDAFSLLMFIKTWATIVRGDEVAIRNDSLLPCFDAPKLFPSQGQCLTSKLEEVVAKRFVFSATKLAKLQSKYSNGTHVVSTGLALLAFLYSRIKAACSPSKDVVYEVFQAVNVRSKIDRPPPMNHFYFGNLIINAMAKPSIDRMLDPLSDMVDRMRESTNKIDTTLLKKIQDGKEDLSFIIDHFERAKKGEIVCLGFSNYSRLPTYESDFGWGKPVWVTSATPSKVMKNLIVLVPGSFDKQIEAYVCLSKEDMNNLETDHELKAFTMKPLSCKL